MFGFGRKNKGLSKAKENLKNDYGLLLSRAPDEKSIVTTFSDMVSRADKELSDDAQTALLYRLYCLNFLAVSKIMRDGGEKIDVEDLMWIPNVLNRSVDYSENAPDHVLLETITSPLNQNLEKYLASFGIARG